MRILQLIFTLGAGGAEKFTVDLCNELSKINEVYLCQIQKDNSEASFFKHQLTDNIHYINLGCSRGINLRTFFSIFNLIKEIKPDVVHAHLNTIIYLFLPALIFNHKIKFIHTIHTLAQHDLGFTWQKKINGNFYRRKQINAVAISKECKDSFLNFYKNDVVSIIHNGASPLIKTKDFHNVRDELEGMKHIKSDLVFIHVARFSKEKNQQLLVSGFNRLTKNKINAILVIIGPSYDVPEAVLIRKNSGSNIHYLGPKFNVSDYVLNSDVFVLSSLWEGLPMSLLEAMSCGVIPVCTPAGGIPDVIKDETIGYLSKDFSEEGFFLALKKCIENIDAFDRERLIDYFRANYSMEKCAVKYLDIYKN